MGKKNQDSTSDVLSNSDSSSYSEESVKIPKVVFGKDGRDGKDGKDGKNGKDGRDGKCGKPGKKGKDGKNGRDGSDGKDGNDGKDGVDGKNAFLTYANFYGLQPTNNLPQVLPGMAVEFPTDGPMFGDITRLSSSQFNIATTGNYLVMFNITVVEPAELCVSLNGNELFQTLVARAMSETQLSGNYIITVTDPNTVLSIVNPVGTPMSVTLSANTGTGSGKSLSSHLNIIKL